MKGNLFVDNSTKVPKESPEEKIVHLEARIAELERLAYFDALTGLENRHALERNLELIFRPKRGNNLERRKEENENNVCAMVLDVDFFKKINDTYGHEAGDKVLVEISKRLKNSVRDKDVVARYGGEEFVIFLVEASEEVAKRKAEELRKLIEKDPFNIGAKDQEQVISVTVSVGIAFGDKSSDPKTLIKNADVALYESKKTGRNKVTVSSQ